MVSCVSLAPLNVQSSILVTPRGILNDLRSQHRPNASVPIDVTLSGRLILASFVHCRKTPLPTVCKFSPTITTSSKLLQRQNALLPIICNVSGRVIDIISSFLAKAISPIDVKLPSNTISPQPSVYVCDSIGLSKHDASILIIAVDWYFIAEFAIQYFDYNFKTFKFTYTFYNTQILMF